MSRETEQHVRGVAMGARQHYWISAVCLLSATVGAQTVPNAGSILQQIERAQEHQTPTRNKPIELIRHPADLVPQGGLSVTVKEFRFNGNHLISDEKLTAVLNSFLGRPLDFNGLNAAASAVVQAYSAAGWMVRAYLPEQDISEGKITLEVIEAKFAGVRFEGEPSKRVMRERLQEIVAEQQAQSQALNTYALDRALLLADDLPGISVAGTLVPGSAESATALVLNTTEEPLVFGDVGIDNYGARSTGSQRLSANMNINSPFRYGELISLNLLHTQGSNYVRAGLTLPFGHDGLRMGVNVSALTYKVIDGPNDIQKLDIKGNSASLGLDLSYPLVRARKHNLYFSVTLEKKHFSSEDNNKSAAPDSYADYASNSLRLGLSGNRFDDLGGGGASSATLQWQTSKLSSMLAHKQIESIGRSFNKLSYSLSRQQTLSTDHSLLLSLQGQHATQMLDSSEKLYVGGAGTVRAYPSSELGGERGQVITGEWRWRLNQVWVASAFVDHANVVLLSTQANEAITRYQLRGHGMSLFWQGPKGFNARVTWSQRDGRNPKPTTAGTDSDGTLKKNRIWFNTSLAF